MCSRIERHWLPESTSEKNLGEISHMDVSQPPRLIVEAQTSKGGNRFWVCANKTCLSRFGR
jgi:hypothetical protein